MMSHLDDGGETLVSVGLDISIHFNFIFASPINILFNIFPS